MLKNTDKETIDKYGCHCYNCLIKIKEENSELMVAHRYHFYCPTCNKLGCHKGVDHTESCSNQQQ